MKPVLRRPEAAASFYHLWGDDLQHAACQGLACFAARQRNPARWSAALGREARVYCLGKCYCAPATADDTARPAMASVAYGYIYLRKEYPDALGYTIQCPLEDRFLMRRSELENKMTVLLGGRAAEDLVFAETSTGAADDLAKATEIAQGMVKRYGMERSPGQVTYEGQRLAWIERPLVAQERTYSEETASEIDRARAGWRP